MEIGTQVKYPETGYGYRWERVGTVVEIGTGDQAGRIRVLWTQRVYESGHVHQEKKPIRTWVAAKKLN